MKYILFAIIITLGVFIYYAPEKTGFNDNDIARIKQTIKGEYEKKEFDVFDIQLTKESSKKLVGFVKGKLSGLPARINHACTVTMGDKQTEWECHTDLTKLKEIESRKKQVIDEMATKH